jgi:hypothetical protein
MSDTALLAYVFWHWRRKDVDADEYEHRQRRFHAALASAPSEGLEGSHSFALAGAPWANRGREAYEDWYLVRDTAALDSLNTAAVSASRKEPHDAAAALADGGTAGLYTLRLGRVLPAAAHARWFAKPAGMPYDELWSLLGPRLKRHGAALWMRFMVLGPSPEFCVQSTGPLDLPDGCSGPEIALRSVV